MSIEIITKFNRLITKEWRNPEGKLHREDGPAIEKSNGSKEYWVNGIRHRINGPAIDRQFERIWYLNGEFHRINGPAIQRINDCKQWFQYGKLHRIGGPAAISKMVIKCGL